MKRRMKSIIQVPSDQRFYEICVIYDVNTDKVKVVRWRIFAFEYQTVQEPDNGANLRFLEPISLSIIRKPDGYTQNGIMDNDGVITTPYKTFETLDHFINYSKNKISG